MLAVILTRLEKTHTLSLSTEYILFENLGGVYYSPDKHDWVAELW